MSKLSGWPEAVTVLGQFEFDGGRFPAVIENCQTLTSLAATIDWLQTNQVELEQTLGDAGALLFRGFPIDSAEAFDAFSAAFGYPYFTYQ